MKVILLLIVVAVFFAILMMFRPGANLQAEYDQRRLLLKPTVSEKSITVQDIAHLPAPVQRYMHRSGSIGKPAVSSVHVTFDTVLYQEPGSTGMAGPSHQIDIIDPPRRLFFMKTRMYGLPVAVLHNYEGDKATMRVRLARLFDVINMSGQQLSRAETVTILNDIAIFAPSAFIGSKFQWTALDNTNANVTYTNGVHAVSANLTFDDEGDLVDFVSNDRGELQKDGSLKLNPWSTPISDFRVFEGRRVPGIGKAIYHRDTGPFTYGIFKITNVRFNQAEVN